MHQKYRTAFVISMINFVENNYLTNFYVLSCIHGFYRHVAKYFTWRVSSWSFSRVSSPFGNSIGIIMSSFYLYNIAEVREQTSLVHIFLKGYNFMFGVAYLLLKRTQNICLINQICFAR